MSEISKRIQEMELKASKFDDLKSNFESKLKKIHKLCQDIQTEIDDLAPQYKLKQLSRNYTHNDNNIDMIYAELQSEDGKEYSVEDIQTKFEYSYSQSHRI